MQEKLTIFPTFFEFYQILMYNFKCQNVFIFLSYVTLTRIIETFSSGNIDTVFFWHGRSWKKNWQFFLKIFEL